MLRVILVLLLLVPVARALEFPVVERTLPNGLRVIVHEDHSAPVVSSYIYFRGGSRNERLGATGIAHLFEHMMFNGGRKFPAGVFDDLIEGNGGATNGFTTRDFTAYLNNFPREALPIVLDLESDRMAHLQITPTNLEQERGIVMEERRLRVDNDVSGAMYEALYLHAFVEHPYRWNPVGFMADLEHITLEEARAFFRTYYAPNNATLVLAGDIEAAEAFRLAARYFGGVPRGPAPPPFRGAEPEPTGERRVVVRRPAELPAAMVSWMGVRATDPDRPALDVAAALLGQGDSARLSLDLVRGHEVATAVSADLEWGIDPDLFTIHAQARPGKTVGDLIARIDAVVAGLAAVPPAAAELAKAKRLLEAQFIGGLKTVSGKANQLGYFATVFGDPRALFQLVPGWQAVTADDVQRVVGRYLTRDRRTIVGLEPVAKERAK